MTKEEMIKEKIIEIVELHSVGRHFGEYREITHEDCECIADELLALFKQEKKEVARLQKAEESAQGASIEYYNLYKDYKRKYDDLKQHEAELEDKIENGTLVELPCKVWDTFYYIRFHGVCSYSIREAQVVEIATDGESWSVYDNNGEQYNLDEIYFTKIEAEKRLEELRGENKENKNDR